MNHHRHLIWKTLEQTRITLPRHLEHNISSRRELPRYGFNSQQRWPIYLEGKWEDIIPTLCLNKKIEEIAANLLYQYLKTTDHEIRMWQKLQDGKQNDQQRDAMLAQFMHQLQGILSNIFIPKELRNGTKTNFNGEYIFGLLNTTLLNEVSPKLSPKYHQGVRLTIINTLKSFILTSPFALYSINWSLLMDVVGTSNILNLFENLGIPIVYLPMELKILQELESSKTANEFMNEIPSHIPLLNTHDNLCQVTRLSSVSLNHLFIQCFMKQRRQLLFPGIRACIQLAYAQYYKTIEQPEAVKFKCTGSMKDCSKDNEFVQVFSLHSGLGYSSWNLHQVITLLVERQYESELLWLISELPSFHLLLESLVALKQQDPLTGHIPNRWGIQQARRIVAISKIGYDFYMKLTNIWNSSSHDPQNTFLALSDWIEKYQSIPIDSNSHFVALIQEPLLQLILKEIIEVEWSTSNLTCLICSQWFSEWIEQKSRQALSLSGKTVSTKTGHDPAAKCIFGTGETATSELMIIRGNQKAEIKNNNNNSFTTSHQPFDNQWEKSNQNQFTEECIQNENNNSLFNISLTSTRSRRFTITGQLERLFDYYTSRLIEMLKDRHLIEQTLNTGSVHSDFENQTHTFTSQQEFLTVSKKPLDIIEVYNLLQPLLQRRFQGLTNTHFGNLDYSKLRKQFKSVNDEVPEELEFYGSSSNVATHGSEANPLLQRCLTSYFVNGRNATSKSTTSKNTISPKFGTQTMKRSANALLWSAVMSQMPFVEHPTRSSFRSRSVKEIADKGTFEAAAFEFDTIDSIERSDFKQTQTASLMPVSLCFESKTDGYNLGSLTKQSPKEYTKVMENRKNKASVFSGLTWQPRSLIPLVLPLSDDHICMITNSDDMLKMIGSIQSESIDIVAIDIEWTPPSSVSLLTIATPTNIYLIDMTCLGQNSLYHGALLNFSLWLFGNPNILKISHHFVIDWTRLLTALMTDDAVDEIIKSETKKVKQSHSPMVSDSAISDLNQTPYHNGFFNRRVFLTKFLQQSIRNVVDMSAPRIQDEIQQHLSLSYNPNDSVFSELLKDQKLFEALEKNDSTSFREILTKYYKNSSTSRSPELTHQERLLKWPSLQSMIQEVFPGFYLDRSTEASNWNQRPLMPSQVRFAALDAMILLIIEAALRAKGLRPSSSPICSET